MPALLLVLTGCQPKAESKPARAGIPARDSSLVEGGFLRGELPEAVASSATADVAPANIARTYEGIDIAANPDIASRKDDVLYITLDGTQVARFADRKTADCMKGGCISWTFRGTASLMTQTGKGKRELYALILQEDAEGWTHFTYVGNERDLTWFNNWPSVSPTGQFVAEGSQEAQDVTGYFRLVDWVTAYPHTAFSFDAGCRPLKWTASDTLQVFCDYPTNDGVARATLGTVKRDKKGQWRLTETAEVSPDDPDTPVAQSKLKLRVLEGKTAAPAAKTASGPALTPKVATEAQLVAEGMDWIGPAGP